MPGEICFKLYSNTGLITNYIGLITNYIGLMTNYIGLMTSDTA